MDEIDDCNPPEEPTHGLMNLYLKRWLSAWIGLVEETVTILTFGTALTNWRLRFLVWADRKYWKAMEEYQRQLEELGYD